MEKPKILVVEDEAITAANLEMSLKDMGYEVAGVAYSGEEAVMKAEAHRPDLVLMDIMLSAEMNGIEAAEILRSRYDTPVIYVTAYGDDEIIERAKMTEPFGYIMKPVEDRELRIAIEMALYKHRMEIERQRLTRELQSALAQIKTLKGLMPICAWCKRIRNDRGYWDELEKYIEEHTDASFTHSICPDCLKKEEEDEEKRRSSA